MEATERLGSKLRKEETGRRRIRMTEILRILGVLSSQFDGLLSWKFVTTEAP